MLTTLVFGSIGTLVETSELQRQAFNEAFAEAGLAWDWHTELYQQLLSVPGGRSRIQLFAEQQGAPLEEAAVASLHERKSELYQGKLRAGELELRPGVARLLREALDNGVQVGLASGTSAANIQAISDAVGDALPLKEFAVVIDASSEANPKPAPDVYELCLKALGAHASEAVAVEDSAVSLDSAVAAGLVTVATPGAYVAHQDFSAASAVLPDLDSPAALRSPVAVPAGGVTLGWLRALVDAQS